MSNWFPIGKAGANTTYTSKDLCEREEGQACYNIEGIDPHISKIIEVDEPVLIEVAKQRPALDENGDPILDENGDPVLENYTELEQEVDENGDPVFNRVKKIVDDVDKKAAKEAEKAAKKAEEDDNAALLAELKLNGSKDIKDLIKILGL